MEFISLWLHWAVCSPVHFLANHAGQRWLSWRWCCCFYPRWWAAPFRLGLPRDLDCGVVLLLTLSWEAVGVVAGAALASCWEFRTSFGVWALSTCSSMSLRTSSISVTLLIADFVHSVWSLRGIEWRILDHIRRPPWFVLATPSVTKKLMWDWMVSWKHLSAAV